MVASVREALGESKTEMAKLAEAETVTAGSLDAMSAYAHAQDLLNANQFQPALQEFQRAVNLDPNLGRAYAGMAVVYAGYLKQPEKAEANYKAALNHLDRMTDRAGRTFDGEAKEGLEVAADRRVRHAQLLGDAGLDAVGPSVSDQTVRDLDAAELGAVTPQRVVLPPTTGAGGSFAIRHSLS